MRDYITSGELAGKIADGWQVIDVRSPQEYSFMKKIPHSRNIPYPTVVSDMERLFPDKKVKLIIVCNGGNRSGVTAKAYREKGYENVYFLKDGIQGWKED